MCKNDDNRHAMYAIAAVLAAVAAYVVLSHTYSGEHVAEQLENKSEPANNEPVRAVRRRPATPQPSCSLLLLLRDLCRDLALAHRRCAPEDVHDLEKHKLPKAKGPTGEPRGTIVGCVAAGLLLTSLGAAFVELYKAKSHAPVKTAKPTISRKCSLADLTVLKHSRKELVRRESIMEIPEAGGPLKPLGFRPPPLYRRCSFPVGPSEPAPGSPGNSYSTYQESRRPSIESRRLSIIDSRRGSVAVDCRPASIDARRVSIDNESPERRHWSRLVHRH